jgi:hypothetical protein|tara:strand:- start:1393 stop:1800 length:408 start_codon:yes stop_codon:yes gene_type:complete
MSIELLSMLGGGITGFVMRLVASQAEAQGRALDAMLQKQEMADKSAEAAAGRGGVWVRRLIAVSILFAVIVAPFILSLINVPVALEKESGGSIFSLIFGKQNGYINVDGFVLLPEVRQGMLALLSFYFGSSMVKR